MEALVARSLWCEPFDTSGRTDRGPRWCWPRASGDRC